MWWSAAALRVLLPAPVAATVLFSVTACGQPGDAGCPPFDHAGRYSWKLPLRRDAVVRSVAVARRQLPFDPIVPSGFGQPVSVSLAPGPRNTVSGLAIAYRAGHSGFDLLEFPLNQEAAVESGYPTPICGQQQRLGTFADGTHWKLEIGNPSIGDEANSIVWYPRPHLELRLIGPLRTFSADVALRKAERLNRA